MVDGDLEREARGDDGEQAEVREEADLAHELGVAARSERAQQLGDHERRERGVARGGELGAAPELEREDAEGDPGRQAAGE
jgi:hypothetical protein